MTELIIKTKNGSVEGFVENGISRWYGIPYAKPPLGDLRFRRARECEPWKEVKKCTKFGGRPHQFRFKPLLSQSSDSEDCLYLNIWRRNNDEKNLPVLVWIHGGLLHCGSNLDTPYTSEGFAKDGLVYVSIAYRLGPLGCYDFSVYNKDLFESNCSLTDQIMALKWIKENIAAFGGDPNNVTIDGESAGGGSVVALMACPSAKGLFQKAICQSGCPDIIHPTKTNKLLMDIFLEKLNIKPEEIEKLKTIDVHSLQIGAEHVFESLPKYPGLMFPNFVYDDLLPENCYDTLRKGSADGVKLLIGTCKNEGTFLYLTGDCPKTLEATKQMFKNNGLTDKFPAFEDFYFKQNKGGDSCPIKNFHRDYVFFLGSLEVADILSERHQEVYMYRFDFMPPLLRLLGLKATHSIDIQMTFEKEDDTVGKLLWLFTRPSSKKIMYDMVHYSWVSFCKTGNPNGSHLPITWERFDSKTRKTLLMDRKPSLVEDPEKEKIELWYNTIKTHLFYM